MNHAPQIPFPPGLPTRPLSPRRVKVITQRLYREKEGECFSTLRDVIKELTGEELQKRQEILMKEAIDLLWRSMSELKRQRQAQEVPCEICYYLTAQAQLGVPVQPSQTWQFDAQPNIPSGDQSHHITSNMYLALDEALYQGCGDNYLIS